MENEDKIRYENIDFINNYLKNKKNGDILNLTYGCFDNLECVLINKRKKQYITVMIKKQNNNIIYDEIKELYKQHIRKISNFLDE